MIWREVLEKIIIGAVASALTSGAIFLSGWASQGGVISLLGGVSRKDALASNEALPAGVVLFVDDVRGCQLLGDRWEDTGEGGKFIVSAIRGDSRWNYHQTGGRDGVVLNGSNMPTLYLNLNTVYNNNGNSTQYMPNTISFLNPGKNGSNGWIATEAEPHAAPIDTVPPYIALYSCRKK